MDEDRPLVDRCLQGDEGRDRADRRLSPGTVKSRLSRALRTLAASPAICGLKEQGDVG